MTNLSLDKWRAEIDGNVVRTPGVDWGRPLEIIHHHKRRLVLRRKGHMAWASIGETAYVETLYMLVEVDGGHVTVLERVEPGRKYRQAIADLVKKCGGTYKPPPPKPKKQPLIVRPASPAAARRLAEGHGQAQRGEMLSAEDSLAVMEDLVKRRVFSSLTQGPGGDRQPEYVIRVSWSAAFDPDDKGDGHRIRRGEVTANLGIEGVIEPFTDREMQDITFAAKMAAAKCLRERKIAGAKKLLRKQKLP